MSFLAEILDYVSKKIMFFHIFLTHILFMLSAYFPQNYFSCRDSWGSLPQDLLKRCVNVFNPMFAEGEALRRVNTHWNKTFRSFREGGFKEERPWFLYREWGSGEARLYDPTRERLYNGVDHNLQGSRFLGSTKGWVIMANSVDVNPRQHHQTFLYNPFTSQRYELPRLTIEYPFPGTVVRYGVITGDPREDDTYACLLTNQSHESNVMVLKHKNVPRLQIYYVAKKNGEWEQKWSVTSIPTVIKKVYTREIESISPSKDKLSIRISDHNYEFTFQTKAWEVSETTQEDDPIEWDPFHDQSFVQVKERLQLPPRTPTCLAIIGTTTERERVINETWEAYYHIISYIDGVWIEVRA